MQIKPVTLFALAGVIIAALSMLVSSWNLSLSVFRDACLLVAFVSAVVYLVCSNCRKITNDLRIIKLENKCLLSKADTAELNSLTKSQFLANMSHEIRTPMSAILGFVELMDDPILPVEERLAFSKIIRSNSEYLIKVINDILDISKIENGSLAIRSVETRMVKVISSVVAMMTVKAKEKNLKLLTEYWSELPEVVLTDECRVRQILVNLIGNAIKFTKQGCVSLHGGCYPSKKPGFVCLEIIVRDTGEGLSPAQKDQLFTMFTQVNTEFGDRPIGTGLGLALSRRLANMMEGDVRILESTPGKGSSFIFSIPVKIKPSQEDQVPVRILGNLMPSKPGSSSVYR